MSFKIIFLDIDGTILRPDDTIEPSTKKAIAHVQQLGVEAVLATGRPIHEIQEIGEELKIDSYIGYNGALAVYNGEEIFAKTMARTSVKTIVDVAKQQNHDLVLYTNNRNYFLSLESLKAKKFIDMFHLKQNALFTEEVMNDILGITLITNGENDQIHYEHVDGFYFSQVNVEGMRHCFDIIRDKVNKGVGVTFLLKRLGLEKEEAVAFGDGMNDKEMLSAVGEGVAMGNSHEKLFLYAKHRTTSVTNSGIYNGLKSLGLID